MHVGRRIYRLPSKADVRSAPSGRMVYVRLAGRLRVLTELGEVTGIPDELRQACLRLYFEKSRAT